MMSDEHRLGVLMHVSVSDVQPHIDHAARALASRRRRRVTWQYASAGFVVGVAVVALVATQLVGWPHRVAAPASDVWQGVVTLDAGRLVLLPPERDAVAPLSHDEALAAFHGQPGAAGATIVAAKWGRATVRSASGKALPGFEQRPAWTIVYRVRTSSVTCPAPAGRAVPASGDFSDVQVFVIAAEGARALYSQPGSWSCGLPTGPVAQLPESSG